MISDPFAEPLVRAVGVGFFIELAEKDGESDGSAFAMPGMVDWIAARTRFFDGFANGPR
jgi:O-methyltransferase involved in polyketide biosynthesis